MRAGAAAGLRALGLDLVEGCTNFVLAHLPASGQTAGVLVAGCMAGGVYLRDCGDLGATMGDRTVRTAVKDAATNARIVAAIAAALRAGP